MTNMDDYLPIDRKKTISLAQNIISTEQKGIEILKNSLDDSFTKAIDLILATKGKVIVSGIGKSGHIANKIAATFASTGTPSFFVHPTEATHGDLGMISDNDSLIVISNSGLSRELNDIINYAVHFDIPLIAITSNLNSDLAKAASVILKIPSSTEASEACPLGKAPTTSTTAALVLGDALAITLLHLKGFNEDNYKNFHPGGSLGASLLKISEIMHKDIPTTRVEAKMSEALLNITAKSFGCTAVINKENIMVGVITDGDIRRHMSKDFLNMSAKEVMTTNFTYIHENDFASKAFVLMQKKSITNLFILNEKNNPIGIIHLHDLINLGLY